MSTYSLRRFVTNQNEYDTEQSFVRDFIVCFDDYKYTDLIETEVAPWSS